MLINAETERMFGYDRHELVGKPVDILVPTDLRRQHAEHRTDFVVAPKARRMGAGRDLYGLRKDGSKFPVEVGLNPIRTPNGMLVLSAIIDITESTKAKEALQQEIDERRRIAEVLNNTFASMIDAVVVIDENANVVLSNPAASRLLDIVPGLNIDQ